jgi:tripartite-type tricarboxylate transporter receptor subunit TctC
MKAIAVRLGSILVAGVLSTPHAGAQSVTDYPSRPVRIIVAFPAGGGVDATARVVGDQLQRIFGQPVPIDNRTGAGGNIAGEAVAVAAPDGYTLLATAPVTLTIANLLYKKLAYDPTTLVPVAIVAMTPNVLAVRHDHPAKSVAELIAHAKANPGMVKFASQGIGATSHLTAALFERRTDTKLVHVPYRGTAPALNDLAGGHVDMMFVDLGSVLPLHQGGRVRILAVGSGERVAGFPDFPTVSEGGVPGFQSSTWFVFAAPPGTPAPIVAKLNRAIVDGLATPEAQAKYRTMHVEASKAAPAEVAEFVKSETQLWGDVIRAAGITLE